MPSPGNGGDAIGLHGGLRRRQGRRYCKNRTPLAPERRRYHRRVARRARSESTTMTPPASDAADRIDWVRVSSCYLPLATPISDAKVLTGRQKPMTEIAMLFAEIETRGRPRGPRLQLLQARRRPGPVRACEGDRAGAARRRPERHRQALEQAVLGRRVGRPQRHVDAGDRRLRRRAVRPEGQARRPVAGQAARLAARLGALLQHLGRVPAHAARPAAGQRRGLDRARHRRHQAQGRPARSRARHQARRGGAQAPGRRRCR